MSFVREYAVKAVRKPHRCDGCGRRIEPGGPAQRWVGMTDGEFGSAIYHPDCREAEVDLNQIKDCWGDDWFSLREIDDEDRPWLLEEYPAVAARMFGPQVADTGEGRS